MCWEVKSISKDKVNRIGVAVYQKPISNECYDTRLQNHPPLCKESDDPNAAWYLSLIPYLHFTFKKYSYVYYQFLPVSILYLKNHPMPPQFGIIIMS